MSVEDALLPLPGPATARRSFHKSSRISTLRLYITRIISQKKVLVYVGFFALMTVLVLYSQPQLAIEKGLAIVKSWKQPEQVVLTEEEEAALWKERAAKVKKAFKRVWDSYERFAFPADELRPLSRDAINNMNGWGVTGVDALSTLLLMGFKPEANRVIRHITTLNYTGEHRSQVTPFFETTIRYLGGMLSAYHLSGETNADLLRKADELATVLLPAFNTPSGLPHFSVDSMTGETRSTYWNGGMSLLAEVGTCQLEFKYLAKLTGKDIYFEHVDRITTLMEHSQLPTGLWNTFFDPDTGKQVNSHQSVGAWADSAYEYLLKEYLMTGQTDERLLKMYMRSAFGAIAHLTYLSPRRKMMYITDTREDFPSGVFEHLSCFYPGLLALGTHVLPSSAFSSPAERELHQFAARGVANSCWLVYKDMGTGLGADEVFFEPYAEGDPAPGQWMLHYTNWTEGGRRNGGPPGVVNLPGPADPKAIGPRLRDYSLKSAFYMLRPETIEAMYLMWKTTGERVWRERNWEIFQSLQNYAQVLDGYATVHRVDDTEGGWEDSMPSFLFAETLKYLYLTFTDDDPLPLDKYVFNTEAHPLPVFTWTKEEQKKWDRIRAGGKNKG